MNQNENQQQVTDQKEIEKKNNVRITAATKDRAEAAKLYIEKKYAKMLQKEIENKEYWNELYKKMQEMQFTPQEQMIIKHNIIQKEGEHLRKFRSKKSTKDYEPLTIIGRGAFGEVRICRDKQTQEIVAIKRMKKQDMSSKAQIGHIRSERDVLSTSGNPWIIELKQSFQDDKYLYLVMDYMPGGDLMNVLIKKDILTEEEAKFYIAEILLAIESVHKMNYIHRDLKPDNILIGADGHIKLSDFGLCKQTEIRPLITFGKKEELDQDAIKANPNLLLTKRPLNYKKNRHLAFSTVGTPDYIAPEVFGQSGYTETVDWWSLGIILFEMLVGYPPFYSDDPPITCQKIIQWKKIFSIPAEANLSIAAQDLIRKLIADSQERLGRNGATEIKIHPFFEGINWKKIREKKAPYIPEVKSIDDPSNFDKFEDQGDPWEIQNNQGKKNSGNIQLNRNFFGYEYNRQHENSSSPLRVALDTLQNTKMNSPKQYQQGRYQNVSPLPYSLLEKNNNQNKNLQQKQEESVKTYTVKNINFLQQNQQFSQKPTNISSPKIQNNQQMQFQNIFNNISNSPTKTYQVPKYGYNFLANKNVIATNINGQKSSSPSQHPGSPKNLKK